MDLITSSNLIDEIGRIAQLGERCPYKAEVTGSIPVPPTTNGWDARSRTKVSSEISLPHVVFLTVFSGHIINLVIQGPPPQANFTGPSFSLVRTPDCQSGGRGFKSRRPRHFSSCRAAAMCNPRPGVSKGHVSFAGTHWQRRSPSRRGSGRVWCKFYRCSFQVRDL